MKKAPEPVGSLVGSLVGALVAPSAEEILALAEEARAALPDRIRAASAPVVLRVAELAPDEVLASVGARDPFDVTGLYEGTPLTERGDMAESGEMPPAVWLYRRAILDEWAARPGLALGTLVAHVLVHEFAHHFGWSDEEIAAIDPWWDWQDSAETDSATRSAEGAS